MLKEQQDRTRLNSTEKEDCYKAVLFYYFKGMCARSVAAAKTSAVALFYYLKNMCARSVAATKMSAAVLFYYAARD